MSNSSASRDLPTLDLGSRPYSKISIWFHGRSVVGNEKRRATKTWLNMNPGATSRIHMDLPRTSGLPSPSSTRSLIDPSSSPNLGSDPATSNVLNRMCEEEPMPHLTRRYDEEEHVAMTNSYRTRTRLALSRPRRKPPRGWFPRTKSRKLKRKAIGCLISGGLLTAVSTICKFETIENELTLINDRHRTRSI